MKYSFNLLSFKVQPEIKDHGYYARIRVLHRFDKLEDISGDRRRRLNTDQHKRNNEKKRKALISLPLQKNSDLTTYRVLAGRAAGRAGGSNTGTRCRRGGLARPG